MIRPSERAWARRLAAITRQVSTRPTVSSYVWGGRVPPLPFLAFHMIYLLRFLFSPLQWLKFLVRRRLAARTTTNLRPDFPSAFTEWHFIILLAAAGAGYAIRDHVPPLPPTAHLVAAGERPAS